MRYPVTSPSTSIGAVLAEHARAAAWPGEELGDLREQWARDVAAQARAVHPGVADAAPRWAALSHDDVHALGLALMLDGIAARAAGR
jgi:hypothetical protein